jgi:hypothetical protein
LLLGSDEAEEIRGRPVVSVLTDQLPAHTQIKNRLADVLNAVGVVGEGFSVNTDSGPDGVAVVVGLGVREGVEG